MANMHEENDTPVLPDELSWFLQSEFCTLEKICNLIDWFLAGFVDGLQNIIEPKFWASLDSSLKDDFYTFPTMINMVYDLMQGYFTIVEQLQIVQVKLLTDSNDARDLQRDCYSLLFSREFFQIFRAVLLSECPVNFRSVIIEYYSLTFGVFQAKQKDSSDPTATCISCANQISHCCCKKFLEEFALVNKKLLELNLFESLLGDVPICVAQKRIEKHIEEICYGSFEISRLLPLRNWLSETVLKWLSEVYPEDQSSINSFSSSFKKLLAGYKDRLLYALYKSYADVRMDQMFDLITEYPYSQPALEDLSECINIAGLKQELISSLKVTMKTRLLHSGVCTSDILTAYISTIKALRVLDSSGAILQLVCKPISKYLRTRDDTVRCIVSNLTDERSSELTSELMKGHPLPLEDTTSDEDMEDWENWMPEPVDADSNKTTKNQRSADIISMLVEIYGSKEMFFSEYHTQLADRLLSTFSYNTEREIHHLELLKMRFGEENELHLCDVMLKDIANSKCTNKHLNSADMTNYEKGDFPVNTMILSAQFWPSFKEEKMELPDYIWQHLIKYTAAFETLKGDRTLSWKPHLGNVELSIEFKERTVDLSVSPVHATILWHFQDRGQWTLEDLANVMKMQTSVLRRKIAFWQNNGILKEDETDVFVLIEEQKALNQNAMMIVEHDAESVIVSSEDQREEELQTFWSYIVGMLTNMEPLSLDRIHSIFRMFAMQGSNTSEFTIQSMKQFLGKKVREKKLLHSGGLYQLPRSES